MRINKFSMKISIIIPCYNEEKYILEVLKNVNIQKKKFNLEIIVSDDGSKDKTVVLLKKNKKLYNKLITSKINYGKGSAIRKAFSVASGKYVLIQDADLEYSPKDYSKIFDPALKNNADVVFGSRFISSENRRVIYYQHQIANKIITFLCNIITNVNLSDVEVGYKLIKTSIVKKLNLKENSFGIEIELAVKLAKLKLRIFEVGISYNGRSYEEGKKIKAIDAFIAIYCIFKYRFFSDK